MTRRVPDAERLAVWQDFLQAHSRVMRALERDLRRDAGLTGAQYDVLVHLARADGGRLRMSELAGAVQYSSGAATKLLDPLVRSGLVRREPDPRDRRTVYAVITDDGQAAFAHASRDHLMGIQREFGVHLPPDELAPVRDFLRRLVDPAS